MQMRSGTRGLALAALLGGAVLGACSPGGTNEAGTNEAPAISGRNGPATEEQPVGASPNQAGQTTAEQAGAVGPGSTAGTTNVNANTQSTHTQVDSTPERRPDAGPGND